MEFQTPRHQQGFHKPEDHAMEIDDVSQWDISLFRATIFNWPSRYIQGSSRSVQHPPTSLGHLCFLPSKPMLPRLMMHTSRYSGLTPLLCYPTPKNSQARSQRLQASRKPCAAAGFHRPLYLYNNKVAAQPPIETTPVPLQGPHTTAASLPSQMPSRPSHP